MKPIRIGIFGLQRGGAYIDHILANNGEIVAVCDRLPKILDDAVKKLGGNVAAYNNFDDFIEHPMDAVLLTNYFPEHAPYAIRCLEKNIHVLSECTSNGTLAEGVALVRAAEKSSAFYMLAENYPFMLFNQEMRKIYKGGTLGKVLYAEGEYNHPGDPYNARGAATLRDSLKHWRFFNPATYYITHSLAPIVYATGSMPVRVSAYPVHWPRPDDCAVPSYVSDRSAIITCLNDDDSVFKVSGCSGYGAHGNSYRICCTKGQVENVRGTNKVMLRYNDWEKPEGMEAINFYEPELIDKDAELIRKAGHGGGDFFVIRKFFECLRTDTKPEMDVYFGTRLASVAILAHRSILNNNMPYDIPDFRKEEDRVKFENDTACPFWRYDNEAPNIPCNSRPDYAPTDISREKFLKALEERFKD